jgi:hypothetical protein
MGERDRRWYNGVRYITEKVRERDAQERDREERQLKEKVDRYKKEGDSKEKGTDEFRGD